MKKESSKNDDRPREGEAGAGSPAWLNNLVFALLCVYVAILAVGVVGILFDIQAILDFFAFLSP